MTEYSAKRVKVEQVNILCRRTPIIVIGTLLVTAILVYVLNTWFPLRILLIWATAVLVFSLIRIAVIWFYTHTPTTLETVDRRSIVLTVHSGLSGCLWGFLGYVFVDVSTPVASTMIIMVLTGMVASSIASLAVVLPAFIAFMFPAFLPSVYRFASFGDEVFSNIAILIVIFMLASLYFAIDHFRTVRNSIRLQYENLNLISDLSQEKQRADEARIKAESSNIAKSKFLAAASHDLRQPMHALRLFTTELKERTQESEYQIIANNIGVSVEALEGLFNALLDISKLDAGTLTVDKKHFKLQTLLDRMENDYAGRASEKKLKLEIEPSTVTLYTDPTLLERILRNLLCNALSYTQKGKIILHTNQTDTMLTLHVEDTGQGINPDDQNKIFEEFTQLHNPQRDRSKGLGLGLSIVKRLALLLEHPLTLDSTLGSGSIFSVTIPLGDESTITNVSFSPQTEEDFSKLFVLVIEDEPNVREGLSRLLKHWQCIVVAVASLDEALHKLKDYEFEPDVILSDYRLPEHNTGIEAITELRARYDRDIPALIMTGDTAPERLKETHASGIPLLHKPFEPVQLKAFLANIKQKLIQAEQDILEQNN